MQTKERIMTIRLMHMLQAAPAYAQALPIEAAMKKARAEAAPPGATGR